ncbi:MAG: MFS transporter [Verrucomicrobia bacterium]|nr:MFS transporter [Verrucomicrobiota bacterium]
MLPLIRKIFKKCQTKGDSFLTKYKQGAFSFICLNTAQFFGVLNDNIYKLLVIFFLLSTLGVANSSFILSTAGALYVLPFLLFSSAAGILADRFSKHRLIQILKAAEILIMLAAILAFYTKSAGGCYLLLFLLASHSALFGPSKYGILPELIEKAGLPKANGHITAFTYLAMIIGTFLASFFTEISHGNFMIGTSFCVLFSLIGFISSLGIQKTSESKSSKKMSLFFIGEIFQTIKECRSCELLLPCLFGSAYFLFIGAFTQLNIIPLAINALHLSEYAGGYLFLFTAIGIAIGSFLCGKFLKKRPSLGLSCFAGFVIGLVFILIALFSPFLVPVATLLALLGVFGGTFIISFDTFIQTNSLEGKRGQTIAAANFLSFFGVLVASFYLYVSGDLLGLSAATTFFCMGILTLIISAFLSLYLLEVFLPFLARHTSFYKTIPIMDPLKSLGHDCIFVMEKAILPLLWTIYKHSQKSHLIFLSEKKSFHLKILSLVPSIHFLPPNTPLEKAILKAKSLQKEDLSLCIILNGPLTENNYKSVFSFFSFKEESIYLIQLQTQEDNRSAIGISAL